MFLFFSSMETVLTSQYAATSGFRQYSLHDCGGILDMVILTYIIIAPQSESKFKVYAFYVSICKNHVPDLGRWKLYHEIRVEIPDFDRLTIAPILLTQSLVDVQCFGLCKMIYRSCDNCVLHVTQSFYGARK